MRMIKLGLLSFVFLFVLLTLISLLFPAHIRLSRAVNLPNQPRQIFALLRRDTLWHPAYQDTAAAAAFAALDKKTLEQTDSTFVVRLKQNGYKPVISGWQLYGAPSADSVTLQWYMDIDSGWLPWQKFGSLFYESTYGAMMEKGLANIRRLMIG